jgi:hypothetical protein
MLTVLILLIRRNNPVIAADFTEAKRNIQDVKNKYCILLLTVIYSLGKQPGSIYELFQIV